MCAGHFTIINKVTSKAVAFLSVHCKFFSLRNNVRATVGIPRVYVDSREVTIPQQARIIRIAILSLLFKTPQASVLFLSAYKNLVLRDTRKIVWQYTINCFIVQFNEIVEVVENEESILVLIVAKF